MGKLTVGCYRLMAKLLILQLHRPARGMILSLKSMLPDFRLKMNLNWWQ
jgi:hypothetical protein